MMEEILAVEEEHADDLADLLVAFPDESGGKKQATKVK
jgi:bacterioferritin (cytochrome b1)